MKKRRLIPMMILCIVFIIGIFAQVNAADEYTFEIEYTGDIIKGEQKDAVVVLKGVDGTPYTNVRIKVDIDGPSTPKLLATDSLGNELDIAQIGYWGPDVGFAVGGTFENRTPIKATFQVAGTYKIKLSLINVASSNAVITTRDITLTVKDNTIQENNTITNNIIANNIAENTIEELPQTGINMVEVIGVVLFIAIASSIGFKIYKTRK